VKLVNLSINLFCLRLIAGVAVFFTLAIGQSFAVWVWTPETGKFINPKYAVKDSPKEQFEYAEGYFNEKNYKKAIPEFQKLINAYQYSEYAARAQYYLGRCHEEIGNLYQAFLNYQKVIDSYPYSRQNDEIIEREYRIADAFFGGQKAKVLGVSVLPSDDKAIEIFKKIITNAPFGEYADTSLYKIGLIYQKSGRHDDANEAFQRIVDEYPASKLIEDARYQIAFSTYKSSLGADYDQSSTDKAIDRFEGIAGRQASENLKEQADETLKRLMNKKATKDYEVAQFYQKRRKYKAAQIYYEKIIREYPDTTYAVKAELGLMEVRGKAGR